MDTTPSGIIECPGNETTVLPVAAGLRYWLHGSACTVQFGQGPNGDKRSAAQVIAVAGWILEAWPCSYRAASIVITMAATPGAFTLTAEPMPGFKPL